MFFIMWPFLTLPPAYGGNLKEIRKNGGAMSNFFNPLSLT